MSSGFVLLAAGTLIFFWLFFMLADYSWEEKKLRGLDSRVRESDPLALSERAEYVHYSWIRYLTIILITYINALVLADLASSRKSAENPTRVIAAISLVLVFVILLHDIDNFWDRKRRVGLGGIYAGLFWSYFWVRYPALVAATIAAAKWGIQA